MNKKLLPGYLIGALVFIYTLYAGYTLGINEKESIFNVLLCLAGGLAGWITGILITPKKGEKAEFQKIGGVLMTFVTGFLLAKLEPLLDFQQNVASGNNDIINGVLLFSVSFGVGALYVFVGRKYWQSEDA